MYDVSTWDGQVGRESHAIGMFHYTAVGQLMLEHGQTHLLGKPKQWTWTVRAPT